MNTTPVKRSVTARGGVRIAYDLSGSGRVTSAIPPLFLNRRSGPGLGRPH